MKSAKELEIKPINARAANYFVRANHYSGKEVPNSQLHLGVFANSGLHGVMQFGPPMHKRRAIRAVKDTLWNGMLELNRMAFDGILPKNSESRALSVAARLIKKNYPSIEWMQSFADATQCGDGAIYRAAGFLLVQIKRNTEMIKLPGGKVVATNTLGHPNHAEIGRDASWWAKQGAKPVEGFMIKYIYFLNREAISRLTVPILPYSAIQEAGAGMYLGRPKQAMAGTTGTAAG